MPRFGKKIYFIPATHMCVLLTSIFFVMFGMFPCAVMKVLLLVTSFQNFYNQSYICLWKLKSWKTTTRLCSADWQDNYDSWNGNNVGRSNQCLSLHSSGRTQDYYKISISIPKSLATIWTRWDAVQAHYWCSTLFHKL